VILNAEDRQAFVPQPFQRLVVQIDVTELDVGGQPGRVDCEAVVLGRDLDLARRLIPDRVIGASMTELELEGLGAKCLAEELMAQANPENRYSAPLGRGFDKWWVFLSKEGISTGALWILAGVLLIGAVTSAWWLRREYSAGNVSA